MSTAQPLLSVRDLVVHYGGIEAVKGISFEIAQGECVSLIGANGAGKTTTLKAITGTLPAATVQGTITYANQIITALPAFNLPSLGLAMVPEGRGVFARMSIKENLLMGAYTRRDHSEIETDIEKWFTIFPRLKERADQLAGTLSGGERQMLAISRALVSRPKLLLLDEPSLGLAPLVVEQIIDSINILCRTTGLTVLLVEQNANTALGVADHGVLLALGKVVADRPAAELRADANLRAAYLGY